MSPDPKRIKQIDSYFRAANYLSVGQIYLKSNPLLKEPLLPEHVKERLLGHFGTSPGLNFIYVHLNRLIQDTGSKFLYITGPGHGGPALRANVFLEGTMSEVYQDIPMSTSGVEKLMRDFSWPGGVPSHVSPPTPGSIHEGGELGYSLAHAYGAALDSPDLIVACVVGDGEAETGPLAASWLSNRFIHPKRDGAVLPILHLNGYKISGPTLLGRTPDEELDKLFTGFGYQVRFIEGNDPMKMHEKMWPLLDWAHEEIRKIQKEPFTNQSVPKWPLIIMRTLKGWTGPKIVDNKQVEGTFRSHQVPLSDVIDNVDHRVMLEEWLKSYHPEELFDHNGFPQKDVLSIVPKKELRMGNNPAANGGLLLKELQLPDYTEFKVDVPTPGTIKAEATRVLGKWLKEIFIKNAPEKNFRIFCPDETKSNRLDAVFETTDRMYLGDVLNSDDHLSSTGRVMEVLSEHLCQGWLEGYLLTGRHGLFPCYEAFALIVDSMLNQHGKWLKACQEIPWRKPIASLNYLLTSHAWRQDHNGYSHQGPGFIESILQKKSTVARIYLPPDTNCLLSVANHCLKSKNYINLIIAGKQPMPQWLDMASAQKHCAEGISIWEHASDPVEKPDVIIASAGDTPTMEALGAVCILREKFEDLKIRFVNVIDLFTLIPHTRHPHGLDEQGFRGIFGENIPIVFAFHGHPRVIHELTYNRPGKNCFHVRGYIEEGTTTTPFDMVVRNHMSRYHLAMESLHRIPRLKSHSGDFIAECKNILSYHKSYIYAHGTDIPEIVDWDWSQVKRKS